MAKKQTYRRALLGHPTGELRVASCSMEKRNNRHRIHANLSRPHTYTGLTKSQVTTSVSREEFLTSFLQPSRPKQTFLPTSVCVHLCEAKNAHANQTGFWKRILSGARMCVVISHWWELIYILLSACRWHSSLQMIGVWSCRHLWRISVHNVTSHCGRCWWHRQEWRPLQSSHRQSVNIKSNCHR